MSQENVETIRRVYEGINARLDPPHDSFGPECELPDRTSLPEGGAVVRGLDAALETMREYWKIGDGKIVRLVIHTDKTRALEAAGLSG